MESKRNNKNSDEIRNLDIFQLKKMVQNPKIGLKRSFQGGKFRISSSKNGLKHEN